MNIQQCSIGRKVSAKHTSPECKFYEGKIGEIMSVDNQFENSVQVGWKYDRRTGLKTNRISWDSWFRPCDLTAESVYKAPRSPVSAA